MSTNDAGRGIDALGIFLTGGSSNADPDASLGGDVSSVRVRGMGPIIDSGIPAIRIDNVFPACGEGSGHVLIANADGDLVFTPSGGSAGTPLTIAEGENKIIAGADRDKAMRIHREASGLVATGRSEFTFANALLGALSMFNVSEAQRIAGVTTYRAIMLQAQGDYGVLDTRLWLPSVAGAQAVYSLAFETPVAGAVQSIASEIVAPTGLSWSTPTSEGSALSIVTLDVGAYKGLWIRRAYPAGGTKDPEENVQLAMKYYGA